MVQLKGAYYREICNQYKKFQFLMVQLKVKLPVMEHNEDKCFNS